MSEEIAIRVENIGKVYRIGVTQERYKTLRDKLTDGIKSPVRTIHSAFRRWGARHADGVATIWALKDISFEVKRGEVIGIIGRNGAGKSTLLKILSRITEPTTGYADIHGRVGSLLEVGTGFHPELSGRENIYLNGAILGMRRAEINRKFDEIVAFAEIEKFIDTPVKHYSSGMYMRLAFAVAAHMETEILLVDEVLAVGDAAFQQKCMGKMGDVAKEGRTVLFVSHNMAAIKSLASTALVLAQGQILARTSVSEGIALYNKSMGARSFDEQEPGGMVNENPSPGRFFFRRPAQMLWDVTKPVEIEFDITMPPAITGGNISCSLRDSNDVRLLFARTKYNNSPDGHTSPRVWTIRMHLPPLWLNPGVYNLQFGASPVGLGDNKKFFSDPIMIEVEGIADSSLFKGILAPDIKWEVRESH